MPCEVGCLLIVRLVRNHFSCSTIICLFTHHLLSLFFVDAEIPTATYTVDLTKPQFRGHKCQCGDLLICHLKEQDITEASSLVDGVSLSIPNADMFFFQKKMYGAVQLDDFHVLVRKPTQAFTGAMLQDGVVDEFAKQAEEMGYEMTKKGSKSMFHTFQTGINVEVTDVENNYSLLVEEVIIQFKVPEGTKLSLEHFNQIGDPQLTLRGAKMPYKSPIAPYEPLYKLMIWWQLAIVGDSQKVYKAKGNNDNVENILGKMERMGLSS